MKKKTTHDSGPYETSIKSILTYGRKDVNMAQKRAEYMSFKEILKGYLLLGQNVFYYTALALILLGILWFVKNHWVITISSK